MLFTMRVLVALALCLCFIAPSPVLSFTMPEEKFVENKMADVGEEGTGQNNINSVRFRPHSIPRHLFWLLKLKVQITKSFHQPFSMLLLVSFLIITFIFLFSYFLMITFPTTYVLCFQFCFMLYLPVEFA